MSVFHICGVAWMFSPDVWERASIRQLIPLFSFPKRMCLRRMPSAFMSWSFSVPIDLLHILQQKSLSRIHSLSCAGILPWDGSPFGSLVKRMKREALRTGKHPWSSISSWCSQQTKEELPGLIDYLNTFWKHVSLSLGIQLKTSHHW